MVSQIASIKTTVTHTEHEALILENYLIKKSISRYNILLHHDKIYPYLLFSEDCFPRLSLHRGTKQNKGKYFGPYPSTITVKKNFHLL